MRVCLMIEGQEDVSWDQWVALAQACERTAIEALFRSDHYLSVEGKGGRGSLDAWATLSALAAITSTVRLGTLVSPASFRHPSVLAKMVVAADHVSGGRVELGLGAGWLGAEHRAYGFPFESVRTRVDVLAEQLEIVRGQWAEGPFSFSGEHYEIEALDALPKPVQQPHPPLIVGGAGKPRTVALAAQFATEYNTVYQSVEACRELRGRLDDACERAGRERLPLSLMTGVVIGTDRRDLEQRALRLAAWRGSGETTGADALAALPDVWVVGTVDEAAEQLRELEAAGVERVMLQHLLHADIDGVELIGRELAPAVA